MLGISSGLFLKAKRVVRKNKTPESAQASPVLKWIGVILVALGVVIIAPLAIFLILETLLTLPTQPERYFTDIWNKHHEAQAPGVALAVLIPSPWEKACFIQEYGQINTKNIRHRYGQDVNTQSMSGEFLTEREDSALVLYPPQGNPWAMRVDGWFFDNNLHDGDCVGRDYLVRPH